ncbi:hypothetical protein P3T76_001328 [Phytophthora citrophthora]|uniref:RxLR effector protein n=1 Tax=Phytophthora citrophthora TaxID=4793 RepID=A0AAD9LRV7_9STRA|nr:hypothetical protein P3T76_001328 [Phytophthora citrophthora]
MTARHAGPGARWRASVVVLAALACSQVCVAVAGEESFMKIQLHKQQSRSDLSHRLAHQQARSRRRAQGEAATGDGNIALALSEAPLGVGYGCVHEYNQYIWIY